MSPVQFLASKFPGRTEQEYRSHLGNFQISGMTGYVMIGPPILSGWLRQLSRLQLIGTLSGGQKSRVAFSLLSLQRPHVLLLDEVCLVSLMTTHYLSHTTSRLTTSILRSVALSNQRFVTYNLTETGPGRSHECYPEMERWCYHHLTRRTFYNECRKRGNYP
jgi:hypothetical protein